MSLAVENREGPKGQASKQLPVLNYPDSPDTRGSARFTNRRKHFYFGPYGSAASHVLFGLWKERSEQCGELLKPTDLRPHVAAFLKGDNSAPVVQHNGLAASLFTSAMAIAISLVTVTWLVLAGMPASIDGQQISKSELKMLRTVRQARQATEGELGITAAAIDSRARQLIQLKEEGKLNARIARSTRIGNDDL